MAVPAKSRKTNPVLAGLLGYALPGAGHLYLGRPVRAAILFVVIHAMFWSGIGLGGVFTVNPREEVWWFNAQILTGASGVTSWYRQKHARADVDAEVDRRLKEMGDRSRESRQAHQAEMFDVVMAERGYALAPPGSEVPMVLTGVAGMLNLMCIFDAIMLSLMRRYGEPTSEVNE